MSKQDSFKDVYDNLDGTRAGASVYEGDFRNNSGNVVHSNKIRNDISADADDKVIVKSNKKGNILMNKESSKSVKEEFYSSHASSVQASSRNINESKGIPTSNGPKVVDDTNTINRLKWLSFAKSKQILNLSHLSDSKLPLEVSKCRGLAISVMAINAWKPSTSLLQNFDPLSQQMTLQINFSLFHLNSNQFFGSSWLSSPVILDNYYDSMQPNVVHENTSKNIRNNDISQWYSQTISNSSSKLLDISCWDICYLVTKIVDPSCVLVLELLLTISNKFGGSVVGQYGCGWNYTDLFSGTEHFTSCKGSDNMSIPKVLDLFQGSPRDLQSKHSDNSNKLKKDIKDKGFIKTGCSVNLSVISHQKLLRAQRLIRENKFISKFEVVPGLSLKQISSAKPPPIYTPCIGFIEKQSNLVSASKFLDSVSSSAIQQKEGVKKSIFMSTIAPAKPVLEIPEIITVSKTSLSFPDLYNLECFIKESFRAVLSTSSDRAPPPEVQIKAFNLHIGIHNGHTVLGNQWTIIPLERSNQNSEVGNLNSNVLNLLCSTLPEFKLHGYVQHECIAIISEVEIEVEVPVSYYDYLTPQLTQASRIVDGSCVISISLGHSSLVPGIGGNSLWTKTQSQLKGTNNNHNFSGNSLQSTLKSFNSGNDRSSSGSANSLYSLNMANQLIYDDISSVINFQEVNSISLFDLSKAVDNAKKDSASRNKSYKYLQNLSPTLSMQLLRPFKSPNISSDSDAIAMNMEVLNDLVGVKKIYPKDTFGMIEQISARLGKNARADTAPDYVESLVRGNVDDCKIRFELLKNKDSIPFSTLNNEEKSNVETEEMNFKGDAMFNHDDFSRVNFIDSSCNNRSQLIAGIDLSKELSDPLKVSDFVIQFISFRSASAHAKTPKSIYCTFQFYKSGLIKTNSLELVKKTTAIAASSNADNGYHKLVVTDTLNRQNVPYSIKQSINRQSKHEDSTFVDFLANDSILIDIWDSESHSWIGSSSVVLFPLLRQGKSITRCGFNCEIVNYNSIHAASKEFGMKSNHICLTERGSIKGEAVGTIQIIISHIGCPMMNGENNFIEKYHTWSEILNQNVNHHVSDKPKTTVLVKSLTKTNTEILESVSTFRENSNYLSSHGLGDGKSQASSEIRYTRNLMTLSMEDLSIIFKRFQDKPSKNVRYSPILNLFSFPSPQKSIQKISNLIFSIGRSEFRREFKVDINGFIFCKDLEASISNVYQKHGIIHETFELSILVNYLILRTDSKIVKCKISVDDLISHILGEYKSISWKNICNYFKEIVGKLHKRGADFLNILRNFDIDKDNYLTLLQFEQILSKLNELFEISTPYKCLILEHFQHLNTTSKAINETLININDIAFFAYEDFKLHRANELSHYSDSKDSHEKLDAKCEDFEEKKDQQKVEQIKGLDDLIEEEKICQIIRNRCIELADSFHSIEEFLLSFSNDSSNETDENQSKRISIAAFVKKICDLGPLTEYSSEVPTISKSKLENVIVVLARANLSISIRTLTSFLLDEIDIYRQPTFSEYIYNPDTSYDFSSNIEVRDVEKRLRNIGIFLKQNRLNSEKVFSSFDSEGKGSLTRNQIVEVFNSLGIMIYHNSALESGKPIVVNVNNFDNLYDRRSFHSQIKYVKNVIGDGNDGGKKAQREMAAKFDAALKDGTSKKASDLVFQEQMNAIMGKIKQCRDNQKEEIIRKALQNSTINIEFSVNLGQTVFFEFPLTNKLSETDKYQIVIDDSDCGIIKQFNHWQLLRASKCQHVGDLGPEPSSNHIDQFHFETSGEIRVNKSLASNETLLVPFYYRNLNPQNFISKDNVAAAKDFSNSKGKKKTFSIHIMSTSSGEEVYHIRCQVDFQGSIISHTLNFFEAELSTVAKSIVLSKSPTSIFQFANHNSNNKYVIGIEDSLEFNASTAALSTINNERRIQSFTFRNETFPIDESSDNEKIKFGKCCIDFEYKCKEYSNDGTLYFLVFNDPFYCKLSEIIRVNIRSCQRMDVNIPLASKNNKIDFHLKGDSVERRVAAYITNISLVDSELLSSEISSFAISGDPLSEYNATLLENSNKYYSSRSLSEIGFQGAFFVNNSQSSDMANQNCEYDCSSVFTLNQNTLNQFSAHITCYNPNIKSLQVNVVDVDSTEIVHSWIVFLYCSSPHSRITHQRISIPIEKLIQGETTKISKRVPFRSPFAVSRTLTLLSSSSILMIPKRSVIQVEPGESVDIKLSFHVSQETFRKSPNCDIILFILDEGKNNCEDCISFTLSLISS